MNILVVGMGQLGQCVRDVVNENGSEHEFYYASRSGNNVDKLDITNENDVNEYVKNHRITCILNCSAYTNVNNAETDEENAMKVNCEGPRILAKAMAKVNGRLIHVSTDYVYDNNRNIPAEPNDLVGPTSVYGKTKLMGEKDVMAELSNYMIIRTSWLYSEYGSNFVKTMLKKGVADKQEVINVVYDQVGTPTYAKDLAGVMFELADKHSVTGVFNYCNDGVASWYDFTVAIKNIYNEITSTDDEIYPFVSEIIPVLTTASPVKRPNYSVMSTSKIYKHAEKVYSPLLRKHWTKSLRECIYKIKEANKSAQLQ